MEEKIIKAIFKKTGFSENGYGKKTVFIFSDLVSDGIILSGEYAFSYLKKIKELNPAEGDIVQFVATVDSSPIHLKILRPKNFCRLLPQSFDDSFKYCLNKFLKEEKSLTIKDSKSERYAFSRIFIRYGCDKDFWKTLEIPFKLNSLNWILTEKGKQYVDGVYKSFNRPKYNVSVEPESFNISSVKIGEDKKVDKKHKNLIEFIK